MATAKPGKKAPGGAPAAELARVRILTPVRHDGQDFAQDEEIDLDLDTADALVSAGLAELLHAGTADLSQA